MASTQSTAIMLKLFHVSDLNAISRSIDLICKVLSPAVSGLIMTYVSMLASAIVLAVWNVVSVFIEYSILATVFRRVPDLATKRGLQGESAVGTR
jgi:iron-regulated transporter 1